MQIDVLKSNGALLASGGAPYYGQSRPPDSIPVRSSSQVLVRFWDDNGNPTVLDAATGTLTFTAQPVADDLFTVGNTTYKAVSALTGAANEVFLGANLAGFIANLIGAVNASTTTPETPGTTYGVGTVQNPLAGATAGPASTILFTAWQADASGNAVATTTTSAHASFTNAVLTAPVSTAVEPSSVGLMAQLSWGPANTPLPERSTQWSVNLTNSIRNNGEGAPTDANQSYTSAQVLAAMAQAAAADTPAERNAAITAALANLGSGFTLVPVASNDAKLALTGIAAGYLVRITCEGNRV